MSQYFLLIQNNPKNEPTTGEWKSFFAAAEESGMFRGGSAIGQRMTIGNADSARSTEHIVGFMRFDSDDKERLLKLLEQHPVVVHGGSVELCELPRS